MLDNTAISNFREGGMEPIFQINPELNIPIYQQLADAIRAAVKGVS